VNQIRSSVDDVNKKLSSLLTSFKNPDKGEMKYGISYLEGKNNLMLIYLTNIAFYSLLKSNGKLVDGHPVIKNLIYLKTLMEKTKIIDMKLKSQIERLLKLGEKEISEGLNTNKENETKKDLNDNDYRPRILDGEDEDNDEVENKIKEDRSKMKYRVNKNMQEILNTTSENKNRQKKISEDER